MKKIFTIIFSFILLLSFTGCNSEPANTTEKENNSNVGFYSEKTELSGGIYVIKDYNNGNLVKETVYTADGTIDSFVEYLEYNKDGTNIKKISHYTNGNYSLFCYDDNGNTIETIDYDVNGNTTMSAQWEYDKKGNNIKFSKYNENGILVLYEEYDENGNRTKEINYKDDGSLSGEFTFEYNSYGKIIKKTDYYADFDSHKYYIYEYNSDNKLIKRYYYIDNDVLERIREYDPETGMQINETFYN